MGGRRIGIAVAVLAAGMAALVLLAHVPLVRRTALGYARATIERDYGLRLDADRLDYNLVTLRVGLAGVRVSALDSGNDPFFSADYLSVALPGRSLLGELILQDITITNARVLVKRREDGSTNLPRTSGSPTGDPPPLRIERLAIPQLAVDIRDEQAVRSLWMPSMSVLLTRDDGYVRLQQPGELGTEFQAARISQLTGGAAFDGRAIRFSDLQLRTDEVFTRVDGTLTLIAREPAIDVRLRGSGDATRLSRWVVTNGDLPRGDLAFEADVKGTFDDPRTQLRVTSGQLSWREIGATDVAIRMGITTSVAEVEALQFGFAGGRVSATGTVPFDAAANVRLNATWTGVNTALAVLAAAPETAVAPAAVASGQIDVETRLADVSAGSASVRLQMAPGRNAPGRVGVGGIVALSWRDGAWQLNGRPTLAGVAPLRIAVHGRVESGAQGPALGPAISDGTLAGTVRLDEADVPALLAALRVTGLAGVSDDAVTAGTIEADVELGGRVGDPSMSGSSTVRGLMGPQFGIGSVAVQLSGRPIGPRLDFILSAPEAVIAGETLNDVRAIGRLTDESGPAGNARQPETTLVVDEITAHQPAASGVVKGGGVYHLSSGEYTASIDGTAWQLMATPEQKLAGVLSLHFAGSGTAQEPRGDGQLMLAEATWDDVALGNLTASVQLDGQAALVQAEAPDFTATASGRVQLDAPHRAVIDASRASVDLGRVLKDIQTSPPVAGNIELALRFDGPLDAWRTGSAILDVVAVDATVGKMPVSLAQPARLRYEAERVVVDSLEAIAGETRVSVAGEMAAFEPSRATAGVLVTLTGGIDEVARTVSATGLTELPITGGDGPVALLARVTGSLEAPIVAADLEVGPGSITLQDVPSISDLRFRAHAENGWVELREGSASYEDAEVSVTARAPLGWIAPAAGGGTGGPAEDAELHARASHVTAAILAPFLDASTIAQLSGSVDAVLDVTSAVPELAAVTGELRLDRLDLRIADLPVAQRVPTRIVARGGYARVEAWDWVGQGGTLAVRGQVKLDDRQTDLMADGVVDLRMLTPFVRTAGISTAGRLESRASMTGTLDSPRFDGDLTVTGGEIRLADPRVLVSDLGARAILTGSGAQITSVTGMVNGGALTGTGAVAYRAEEGLTVQLTSSVRGMALEFPEGLRSEVDAALDLGLDVLRPSGRLTGTVTVVRGTYREPLAVLTGFLANMRAGNLSTGPVGGTGDASSLLEALALDVRLVTDEDIDVDNNYGRFQLGADLNVIGTAAAPSLAGRAELREGGLLFVGRNVYTINLGTIDFSNPITIEPMLHVEAATRTGDTDIEVTITGAAENPTVALQSSSNPDLGQAELASLLLTGRQLDDLAPGDAAFVGTQVLGNFSAEVLGFASRAVGLDTLRLGGPETSTTVPRDPTAVATELDPTTRLTFGKSLGSNLDLTFSQSLRDGDAQTWIVDYTPKRTVDLRLVSDDEDLRSYGFRHDLAFGKPVRPSQPDAAASRRAESARIAEVRWSGAPVIQEARLRGAVRLGPGDRFDFADWQADRDRLEELYRRAGYLTARVTPTRSEEPAGMILDYQIVPGPETRILVTGIDLNQTLRSRLEAAWTESVFDDFLVDEATQIIRGELARDHYLQPVVTVRILDESGDAPAPGTARPATVPDGHAVKTLSITIDRGRLTARTIVRVEGVDDAMAGEIAARLKERGLVDTALSDPAAVEREVVDYLRITGHARARVTVGALLFEDAGASLQAVVPVSVDAGPALSIAGVAFDGAGGVADDALRTAAALPDGAPYDPAAVDAARNRLVALYRQEGFPSATVTARPDIRTDMPLVDLTFVVAEGARQVLGEVTVVGNRAIDADVIVRALDLEIGTPLRADAVLQGRTRLFNTALFRRVDVSSEPVSPEHLESAAGGSPSAGSRVLPMRLRVTVEEWPALRLRYGFQVAEERPQDEVTGRTLVPGLSADVVRRTLFGRAVTIGSAVEWQRRQQLGRAFLSTGTFFGLPIGSSLVAERSREDFADATLVTARTRLTWEQRARVARHLGLSYAYTFERNHTFDTKPSDPFAPAFDITINIARFNTAAAWDTRNDPVDAIRGSLASISLEYAPEAVGSDIRFIRQVAQAYHFHPWRRLVLASAARLGVAIPIGGQELIPSERFYGGGARTVRGVAEDSLGPQDFFGGPAGGRMLVVFNQEARVPIYKWLRGVGFIDAGNVFVRPADARLGDLVTSIGFGLRLATPFALLRVDYGKSIWGVPGQSGRWTFGIGHAF